MTKTKVDGVKTNLNLLRVLTNLNLLIVALMLFAVILINVIDTRTQVYTATYPSGPSGLFYAFLQENVFVPGLLFPKTDLKAGIDVIESPAVVEQPMQSPLRRIGGGRHGGGGNGGDGGTLPLSGDVSLNIGLFCDDSDLGDYVTLRFSMDNPPGHFYLYDTGGVLVYEQGISSGTTEISFAFADVAESTVTVVDTDGASTFGIIPPVTACTGSSDTITLDLEFSNSCNNVYAIVVSERKGTLTLETVDGDIKTFEFEPGRYEHVFFRSEVEGATLTAESVTASITREVSSSLFAECPSLCDANTCSSITCYGGTTLQGCNNFGECYTQDDCVESCDTMCTDYACSDGTILSGCNSNGECNTEKDCPARLCSADENCKPPVYCSSGVVLSRCIAGVCATRDDCPQCTSDSQCSLYNFQCNNGVYFRSQCNSDEICTLPPSACTGSGEVCSTQLRGDVNGDGVVDVLDALVEGRMSAGLIPIPVGDTCCYDVNGNGIPAEVTDVQLIAQILAGTLDVISCDETYTWTSGCVLAGDANMDGVVNIEDALVMQQMLSGLKDIEGDACCRDANKDGAFTVLDALYVAQVAAGLKAPLKCDMEVSSSITLSETVSCEEGSYMLTVFFEGPGTGTLYMNNDVVGVFAPGETRFRFAGDRVERRTFRAVDSSGKEVSLVPESFSEKCSVASVASCPEGRIDCTSYCGALPTLSTSTGTSTPSLSTSTGSTSTGSFLSTSTGRTQPTLTTSTGSEETPSLRTSTGATSTCIIAGDSNTQHRGICKGDVSCVIENNDGSETRISPTGYFMFESSKKYNIKQGVFAFTGVTVIGDSARAQGFNAVTGVIINQNQIMPEIVKGITNNNFELFVPSYICDNKNKCVSLTDKENVISLALSTNVASSSDINEAVNTLSQQMNKIVNPVTKEEKKAVENINNINTNTAVITSEPNKIIIENTETQVGTNNIQTNTNINQGNIYSNQ